MKLSLWTTTGLILFFAISNAIAQPQWLEDPPEEITIFENDTCTFELEVIDGGEFENWIFLMRQGAILRPLITPVNSHRCRVSLRPNEDSAGEHLLQIDAVTRDHGLTLRAEINVIVLPINFPPEFVLPIPDIVRDEDFTNNRFWIFPLSTFFEDPDGDTLTYSLNDTLAEIGLLINDQTSELGMDLEPNYFTPEPVMVIATATDGEFTISDTFTVTINAVNDPPLSFRLINPAHNTTAPDMDSVVFIWTNSRDVEGDMLNYRLLLFRANTIRCLSMPDLIRLSRLPAIFYGRAGV